MYRKFLLFILMMFVLSFTACSSQKTSNTSSSTKKQDGQNFTQNTSQSLAKLFDQNNVSLELSSIDDTNISFSISNQSEQSLNVSCHGIAVNTIMTPAFIMEDVKSGETKTVKINWADYSTLCVARTAKDISSITLDLTCANGKDEIFVSCPPKTFTVNDTSSQIIPKTAQKICEEKNISVYSSSFEINKSKQAEKELFITNNSKDFCNVEFMNALLNNSEVDCFAFSEIYPGCTYKAVLTFDKVNEIKSFSVDLTCSDKDYNELFSKTLSDNH